MARIATSVLRIASISLPHDIPLSIAAQIFVAAGVVLIFVINLFFTQRIIRAQHPNLGWNKLVSLFFIATYVLIVITLIMLITSVVQMFYTLNRDIRQIDRDIQLYGLTYFAFVSFLPAILLAISLAIPRTSPVDKFGHPDYRLRHNILIVLAGSLTLCLGASYRAGTAYLPPVPRSQPLPGYYHRACFYIFNFVLEIMVVYFYAFVRIDKRFHIPNGAHGPGSYGRQRKEEAAAAATQAQDGSDESTVGSVSRGLDNEKFEIESPTSATTVGDSPV